MDKKKLRMMPGLPAPEWMTKAAASAKLHKNSIELWYAEVCGDPEQELILRVYERSKLLGGTADRETYRILLGIQDREYIACQVREKPPKCWREGRIDSVLQRSDCWETIYFPWDRGHSDMGYSPFITFSADGERLLEAALGPLENDETWGYRIYRWQDAILTDRRRKRHEKELEPVVKLMEQVPDLPEGFIDWLCTEGIARFDYALYDPPKGKKQTRIQCTRCGAKVMADVKKVRPVKDRRGICPACGRPVTWKTASSKLDRRAHYYRWDEPWYVAVIQRMGKGFIIRYFYTDVKFNLDHGEVISRQCEYGEVSRTVFPDAHSREHASYEKIRYKNQGEVRWAPGIDEYRTDEAFLYTDNLPEELRDTAWKYSGIGEFQKREWPKNIPVMDYLLHYLKAPYLEYFSKMGLTRLVRESVSSWLREDTFDSSGKCPADILKVPPQDIKTLVRLNGSIAMLQVLQYAWRVGVRLSDDDLVRYISLFGNGNRRLNPLVIGGIELDIHKRMKYFKKQAGSHFDKDKWNRKYRKEEALLTFEHSLWNDWDDYIRWLERFMPECMGDEYYILPPDLPKAHDRLMKMALAQKKKEAAERRKRQEEAVNILLAEAKATGGVGMQARGLLIRLPKDAAEIRREGEIQHHCVATYIDRVERKETLILFVRKVDAPDTPFYTLEWKDGQVAQCRGFRNADMTPEVKTFVKAFERRMQEKGRGAVRQRVRVTA